MRQLVWADEIARQSCAACVLFVASLVCRASFILARLIDAGHAYSANERDSIVRIPWLSSGALFD